MRQTIRRIIEHLADEHLGEHEGKMKAFPRSVLWLVYLMSLSVLTQGIADVVIKAAGYTPWIVKFPWRMDFLFLTAISVLMGYQTLVGIQRRELDVTRNSVQIGILVEIALVVGDVYFLIHHHHEIEGALAIRAPFIFFTTINVFILLYLIYRLDLFHDEKGNWRFF